MTRPASAYRLESVPTSLWTWLWKNRRPVGKPPLQNTPPQTAAAADVRHALTVAAAAAPRLQVKMERGQ